MLNGGQILNLQYYGEVVYMLLGLYATCTRFPAATMASTSLPASWHSSGRSGTLDQLPLPPQCDAGLALVPGDAPAAAVMPSSASWSPAFTRSASYLRVGAVSRRYSGYTTEW